MGKDNQTEMLQAEAWRERARAFMRGKLINREDRERAMTAISDIRIPLGYAVVRTIPELKEYFIRKVVQVVKDIVQSDKYTEVILKGLRL